MIRRALTAAAAAGTAAIALGAAAGWATTGPATIRITDVQTWYQLASPNSGPYDAGAVEFVRQRLFNVRITKRPLGHAALVCTYLDRRERTCTGTYFLPRGKLMVAGAIGSRLLYQIAVVGGTGLYDDARGSLTVTSIGLRPRREILLFRLTG